MAEAARLRARVAELEATPLWTMDEVTELEIDCLRQVVSLADARAATAEIEVVELRARVAELEADAVRSHAHYQEQMDARERERDAVDDRLTAERDALAKLKPILDRADAIGCTWAVQGGEMPTVRDVARQIHDAATRGNMAECAALAVFAMTLRDEGPPGVPPAPPPRFPVPILPDEAALCACGCDPCRIGDHAGHDRDTGTTRCPAGDAAETRWREGAGK